MKVLKDDDKTKYEVAWLDKDKNVTGNSLVNGGDLIKKLPFTREVLKSFIKEYTNRNAPWVLHDQLAKKHGISTDPSEELKGKISISNGFVICTRKRKKDDDEEDAEVTDQGSLYFPKELHVTSSSPCPRPLPPRAPFGFLYSFETELSC